MLHHLRDTAIHLVENHGFYSQPVLNAAVETIQIDKRAVILRQRSSRHA